MPIFLNREGILKHFDRLFVEAKKEIVMIVPYIKLSDEILAKLSQAEKKKIEIMIVYRENELNDHERKKLLGFSNVTLLHHPHVHAKCYLNENSFIICSMNLYEHSMKNNREMGVLLDIFADELIEKERGPNELFTGESDFNTIEDALDEVNVIIGASTIDKKSKYVEKNGFNFEIIKTKKNHLEGFIATANKISDNKQFVIEEKDNDRVVVCKNFAENVDLIVDLDMIREKEANRKLEIRRVALDIRLPDKQLKTLKEKFAAKDIEFKYKYYKVYWPSYNSIKIYRDSKNHSAVWDNASQQDCIKGFIKGGVTILNDLKKITEFQKIR